MASRNIYFDNAATTPLHPKVIEKMLPLLQEDFGNPSSIHSFGRKVRVAIEEARETIADFINADASEIYFVSSGTEANNFPLFGIARTELNDSGRKKILSTRAEHLCVLEPLEELRKNGFDISLLDVQSDSKIETSVIENNLSPDTSLVSVIHANNETGTINQIKSTAELTHKYKSYFHSDAVQSFGKIKIDVEELGVDSLSFSSHKINGPKGAGAVYVKSGTPLSPLLFGGSQERNRRGGTENPAAIIGFAEAVKICKENMQSNFIAVKLLRDKLISGIKNIDCDGIEINSNDESLPYILSITLKKEFYRNDAESLLMFLDINGIAASNGAACTSGTLKPSHVMLAMGKTLEDANGTIRFSFGAQNTLEEIEYTCEVLAKLSTKFKS